ncbi:MAG: hypothetical protein COW29_04835 [Rhodobacterales bacterium CG15_BIG_FIL_POST_REV_8_21_14_020_59_13]|nr:MAG: hypothetical protein COW29_04835 [Rhodobacterales bacterium CG15_BIG_FIL_POST_REV_8_21_14_020_59_13]
MGSGARSNRKFPGTSPCRINRKPKIVYDKARYQDRHLVENAFFRIMDWQRGATGYIKLALAILIAF